jgi:mannose-1-phosphate guanylyltransferase
MKAMVLAAGFGTRLRPITEWVPKPMLPLFGMPVIEINLVQLRDQGIRHAIINLHHLPRQIVQHLGNGRRLGMEISYSLEPQILGTAGGIKKVQPFLLRDPFVVVNADTFRAVDYTNILRHHFRNRPWITMLLQENGDLPPGRAVWIDDRDRVSGFLDLHPPPDQPAHRRTDFLGVQVMEPNVLTLIPPEQPWEMRRVYLGLLKAHRPIGASLHQGYWQDLGTPEAYLQIHKDVLDGRCPLRLPAAAEGPGVWQEEDVRLAPDVEVNPPIYLGSGCRIANGVSIGPYAVVGRGCRVGEGARVSHAILWDGAEIEPHTTIAGELVGLRFRCDLSARKQRS